MTISSEYNGLLQPFIDLVTVPFTDRDSRLMVFRAGDCLNVRLAEFWRGATDDALISSLAFTDANLNPQPLQTTVSGPHRVECVTPTGTFALGFAAPDTLLVALPPGPIGITFRVRAGQGQVDRRGGMLRGGDVFSYHIVYTTDCRLIKNDITPIDDSTVQVELIGEAADNSAVLIQITRTPGFNRYVPAPEAVFAANAARWREWFARAPEVPAKYRQHYYFAWWIMGVNLVHTYFHPKREGMVPSKLGYVGIWNWDAYFHALAYRHVDSQMAQDQLRIMLDFQLANGMIPDVVHDAGVISHSTEGVEADVTKPPLTAWAVWKLYEVDGDLEFLAETYEALVRSQQWWFAHRDTDGNGLCEYQHPYSSGLDDSPLWDGGLPVESPDLTAYLILQYDHLAKIAAVLGATDDAATWRDHAGRLTQHLIERRWDDATGLFWARRGDHRVDNLTPFNLFPLITGRMPESIAAKLVAHLTDPARFWADYPVPTVALDDPAFDPETMWRGPVWINVNYLLIDGLLRAGYSQVARDLRDRTLALVMSQNNICEYYHPTTGHKPEKAVSLFGWSAALFIDLVLQAVSPD